MMKLLSKILKKSAVTADETTENFIKSEDTIMTTTYYIFDVPSMPTLLEMCRYIDKNEISDLNSSPTRYIVSGDTGELLAERLPHGMWKLY